MGTDVKAFEIVGGCNFRKGNTYVFAASIIRDRDVGGSNSLVPTNQFRRPAGWMNYKNSKQGMSRGVDTGPTSNANRNLHASGKVEKKFLLR